jgi:ABC-2 type transport system permease protein
VSGGFVGLTEVLRLIVRRDRIRLALWIAVVAAMTIATAAAFARLFATGLARSVLGSGITSNPALTALVGPAFDATTTGGLTAWRAGGIGAVLASLMSLLTVIRHTRAEEEAGRRELLESGAIGRHAVQGAALVTAWAANLLLAATVTVGLAAIGLRPASAAALGLSFALAGSTFAAIAAVAAQLAATARAATGIAAAVLGLSFLARAVGDASGVTALSWASPIGWAQRVRPFAGERWWVFALAATAVAALAAVAFTLSSRRDLGGGLLPARPGPESAGKRLAGPLGLAWRLQRGSLLAWAVALAGIGAALGSVARSVLELLESTPRLRVLLGGDPDLISAFFATTLRVVGVLAAAQAIQAVLRLQAEEDAGRTEPVLAAAVARWRWAASHLVFATVGPALALAAAGAAAGLVHGLRGGGGPTLPALALGALVQLPAVWVLGGLALALHGLAPRWTAAAWAALVALLLVEQLGRLLGLGAWILALSPFAHLPQVPGADVSPAPLAALVAVAGALAAAGLVGLRRRDIGAS